MIWSIIMVIVFTFVVWTAIIADGNDNAKWGGTMFLIFLVLVSMTLGAEMQYKTDTKQCELELPRTEQCVMIAVPESSLDKGEEEL